MIETTSDFIFNLFNLILQFFRFYPSLILKVVFLVFFFVYVYRIIRDFSMFSKSTAFVMALGLSAILEFVLDLFGYLANIFSGLFLFIGGNLGGIVTILVGLVVLLVVYFILSKIGWKFRKQARKAKEAKKAAKREAGKVFLEKVGEKVTKK